MGLLSGFNTNLGKYSCRYHDPVIGVFSDLSQRWIDRNFSLDYTLKSFQKYLPPEKVEQITKIRILLRRSAMELLHGMLSFVSFDYEECLSLSKAPNVHLAMQGLSQNVQDLRLHLSDFMRAHFHNLIAEVFQLWSEISDEFETFEHEKLVNHIEEWSAKKQWELING